MSHQRSRCPCCNSVIGGSDWRDGVRLPAGQLRIYDAVKRAMPIGISPAGLRERLGINGHTMRAQVWLLNENLALIGKRVRAGFAGCNYRLVEWKCRDSG